MMMAGQSLSEFGKGFTVVPSDRPRLQTGQIMDGLAKNGLAAQPGFEVKTPSALFAMKAAGVAPATAVPQDQQPAFRPASPDLK